MAHTSSNIKRIWLLYGSFFAIIVVCIVLFFSNIVANEDPAIFKLIDTLRQSDQQYAIGITNLQCDNTAAHTYKVSNADSTLAITARVDRFDIAVVSDNKERLNSPLVTWAVILQAFAALSIVCIFALLLVLVIASFRSIKSGRIFQQRGIKWIRLIGILLLLLSLALDLSVYLERINAAALLANTDWVPDCHLSLHFTRIFFALIILFVAEIINIGYDIQKEQDLTI